MYSMWLHVAVDRIAALSRPKLYYKLFLFSGI
jgi:hypothetical protein